MKRRNPARGQKNQDHTTPTRPSKRSKKVIPVMSPSSDSEQEERSNDSSFHEEQEEEHHEEEESIEDEEKEDVPYEEEEGGSLYQLLQDANSAETRLTLLQKVLGKYVDNMNGATMTKMEALGLICAVKENPQAFHEESIFKYMIQLLQGKENGNSKKKKPIMPRGSFTKASPTNVAETTTDSISIQGLVCNLLVEILRNDQQWNTEIVNVYLEDALTNRSWVDLENCRIFVQNVLTFTNENAKELEKSDRLPLICNRFSNETVRLKCVQEVVSGIQKRIQHAPQERMGVTASPMNASTLRSILPTLKSLCPLPEIRLIAAQHIESWLNSVPNVKQHARELFKKVAEHCASNLSSDFEVFEYLLKIKSKSFNPSRDGDLIISMARGRPQYMKKALMFCVKAEKPSNLGKGADNTKILASLFKVEGNKRSQPRSNNSATGSIVDLPSSSPAQLDISPSTTPYVNTPGSSNPPAMQRASSQSGDDSFFRMPTVHPGACTSFMFGKVMQELALDLAFSNVMKPLLSKLLKQNVDSIDIGSFCSGIMSEPDESCQEKLKVVKSQSERYAWLCKLKDLILTAVLKEGSTLRIMKNVSNAKAPVKRNSNLAQAGGRFNRDRVRPATNASPRHPTQLEATPPPNISNHTVSNGTLDESGPSNNLLQEKPKEKLAQLIGNIQREAMNWCNKLWLQYCKSPILENRSSFQQVLSQLLFIAVDTSGTESDRQLIEFCSVRCTHVPLHQDVVLSLLDLSKTLALPSNWAIDVLEKLVYRGVKSQSYRELLWSNFQHGDLLLGYTQAGGLLGLVLADVSIINELFQLCQQSYDPPRYQQKAFWKICELVAMIAVFNPESVGKHVWESVPTLRCLLQMILSNRYTYPPLADMQDPKLLHPSDTALSQLDTSDTIPLPHQLASTAVYPPEEVLSRFSSIFCSNAIGFGQRLRQCREVDFLMEMVSLARDSPMEWILNILTTEPSTIDYLPSTCICELIMNILNLQVHTYTKELDQLINRLRGDLFHRQDETIILYFLDQIINAKKSVVIPMALHVLHCLYSHQVTNTMGTYTKSYQWIETIQSSHPEYVQRTVQIIFEKEHTVRILESCLLAFPFELKSTASILNPFFTHRKYLSMKLISYNTELYNKCFQFYLQLYKEQRTPENVDGFLRLVAIPMDQYLPEQISAMENLFDGIDCDFSMDLLLQLIQLPVSFPGLIKNIQKQCTTEAYWVFLLTFGIHIDYFINSLELLNECFSEQKSNEMETILSQVLVDTMQYLPKSAPSSEIKTFTYRFVQNYVQSFIDEEVRDKAYFDGIASSLFQWLQKDALLCSSEMEIDSSNINHHSSPMELDIFIKPLENYSPIVNNPQDSKVQLERQFSSAPPTVNQLDQFEQVYSWMRQQRSIPDEFAQFFQTNPTAEYRQYILGLDLPTSTKEDLLMKYPSLCPPRVAASGKTEVHLRDKSAEIENLGYCILFRENQSTRRNAVAILQQRINGGIDRSDLVILFEYFHNYLVSLFPAGVVETIDDRQYRNLIQILKLLKCFSAFSTEEEEKLTQIWNVYFNALGYISFAELTDSIELIEAFIDYLRSSGSIFHAIHRNQNMSNMFKGSDGEKGFVALYPQSKRILWMSTLIEEGHIAYLLSSDRYPNTSFGTLALIPWNSTEIEIKKQQLVNGNEGVLQELCDIADREPDIIGFFVDDILAIVKGHKMMDLGFTCCWYYVRWNPYCPNIIRQLVDVFITHLTLNVDLSHSKKYVLDMLMLATPAQTLTILQLAFDESRGIWPIIMNSSWFKFQCNAEYTQV